MIIKLNLIKGTLACLLLAPVASQAAVYTVPATANIHSSGLDEPVAPGGGGAGTLPVLYSVGVGESAIQFSASGSVCQFYGYFYHGPDGLPGYTADVSSYGGLSGFVTDQCLSLVGVFLSDNPPALPAPATLHYGGAGLGIDFQSFSPSLSQVFFIGDGVRAGGEAQTFHVPAGATRLFLGFADCPDGIGLPGYFEDNEGELSVSLTAIPEPSSITLAMAGLALAVARRLRTASKS